MEKIEIRKTIARLKKELGSAPDRANVIQKICELQTQLQPENLPTLGQLRRTIEKDIEQEKQKMVLKVSSLDTLWMDKIRTLVRHSKLNRAELDEAEDKGMPRGGFFEKQLIRLMKYFLGLVWERK
jgi:hypothetical protein